MSFYFFKCCTSYDNLPTFPQGQCRERKRQASPYRHCYEMPPSEREPRAVFFAMSQILVLRPHRSGKPLSPVSRPKVGNPMGAEPPWSSGKESRGNRLEIGSLWRVFTYFLHVEKVGRRRRRDNAEFSCRQTANPQNAWRIVRCGGTGVPLIRRFAPGSPRGRQSARRDEGRS